MFSKRGLVLAPSGAVNIRQQIEKSESMIAAEKKAAIEQSHPRPTKQIVTPAGYVSVPVSSASLLSQSNLQPTAPKPTSNTLAIPVQQPPVVPAEPVQPQAAETVPTQEPAQSTA